MANDREMDRLQRSARQLADAYSLASAQVYAGLQKQREVVSIISKIGGSLIGNLASTISDFNETKKLNNLKKQQLRVLESQLAIEQRKLQQAQRAYNDNKAEFDEYKRLRAKRIATARTGGLSLMEEVRYHQLARNAQSLRANDRVLSAELQGQSSQVVGAQNAITSVASSMANIPLQAFAIGMGLAVTAIKAVYNALAEFVNNIRQLQKELGVSTGVGAFLETKSVGARLSGVSKEEFFGAISGFGQEFGGVLAPEAANAIGKEMRRYGVSAQQLAAMRRTFLTIASGDASRAKDIENRFKKQIESAGMTRIDAADIISKNSELFARNGVRFQDAFVRAAIESKKIGVELSKVSQFGDNLVNDFEGFLTGFAELGAMGLGFDTSRLAEIAVSGDDAALFNELRSQLRGMGKDINKLDRPTRLSLESAIGMPISELQRLAGVAAGSGEETMTAEELTRETNSALGTLTDAIDRLILALNILTDPVAALAYYFTKGAEKGAAEINKGNKISGSIIGGLPGALTGAAGMSGLLLLAGLLGAPITGGLSLAAVAGATAIGGGYGAYKANELAKQTKGDDVVSMPGYGKRTLVTPSGAIALNDKDKIIAYADDFAGNMKLPYGSIMDKFKQFAEYGPIVESLKDPTARNRFFKNTLPYLTNKATLGNVFPNASKGVDLLRTVQTPFGTVGKYSNLFTKYASQNLQRVPLLGSLISGGMSGLDEYKNTGSMTRGMVRGGLNIAGGIAGSGLGGFMGGPVGAALGGMGGSNLGDGVFNLLANPSALKEKALGLATKIPGVGGLIEKFAGGGIGKMASGFLGKFGGGVASNLLGGLGTGGIGGMLSLASPLLSKIPGVGKVLGSLSNAPSKLMSGAMKKLGGLFGKKKKPSTPSLPQGASVLSQFEGIDEDSASLLMGSPMMANADALMAGGMVDPRVFSGFGRTQGQQAQQVQVVQDPELKQTIENAIKAGMANIGLHMDGTKVAQIISSNMQGASTFGVLTK